MKTLVGVIVAALAAAPAFAQTDVTVARAELAIPFGVAAGKVALVGDDLIFVNDDDPTQSFAISRDNLAEATVMDQVLTVRTKDKIGDRSEFAFRTTDSEFADAALSWGSKSVSPTTAEAAPAASGPAPEAFRFTYDVESKRLLGSNDQGKLIVTEERVSYESVTNLGRSRQWDLEDIKELKRKNPYKVEIVPFTGDSITFNLLREGMASRDYKTIVDRMAELRGPK